MRPIQTILEEILETMRRHNTYIRERDTVLDEKQAESMATQRRGLEMAKALLPKQPPLPDDGEIH